MSSDTLEWLQRWYRARCDGEWEHAYGVRIETLDNPGWRVRINVRGTAAESRPFEPLFIERSDDDWVHTRLAEAEFEAAGGPGNLGEILELFRRWVTGQS